MRRQQQEVVERVRRKVSEGDYSRLADLLGQKQGSDCKRSIDSKYSTGISNNSKYSTRISNNIAPEPADGMGYGLAPLDGA